MQSKKVAILSDIHGNSWGLSEVLDDIKNRGIETIINLGDSLYGPLDPKGTFELLSGSKMISISGNQDRFILENPGPEENSSTLTYVLDLMDDKMFNWLKQLPFDYIYNDFIYCCHGTPENDSIPLVEKIQPENVSVKDNFEVDKLLSDIRQPVVACGHSHIPRVLMTGNKTIINPGSTGLPAYHDDLPVFHKMESLTPCARYSILTFPYEGVNVNQVAISYDYEKAAGMAEKNNRPDWAEWIRTGRA